MFWLFVIVLLIGIRIGWLLARRSRPGPPYTPPPVVPDTFDESTLPAALAVRLAGTTANGAALAASPGNQVIWVDAGDEVLVHLDSIQTKVLDRMVLISVDLETDQTGRTPLIVNFALGNAQDPAGLVAVTDEYPRGNGSLAARWGETVQAALWSTLLGLAQDHATERGKAPSGISAATGVLTLHAGNPISAAKAHP
jgi:hypothetical protein